MSVKNNNLQVDTSTIWGGRFTDSPHTVMEAINASINFDKHLYSQDIQSSKAHASMLLASGIISGDDEAEIQSGLDSVLAEIETGKFEFKLALEDIHMNIEARLTELIGDAGGRLHTARSRNDQVATDFRLWVRDAIDGLDRELQRLQSVMINIAAEHAATVMPGFTHLQTAQPVTFGHHMLAYVEMIGRDRGRFHDCRKRLNECPLGAGALAGTSFPIDRALTSSKLNFDKPMVNSLDAVSDRDFAIEFLSAASISGMHLSRIGEEIVLWTSGPFDFIRLSDGFSTGSSIMPQKRNPDAAELVRAKVGRIIGALNTLLIIMKGLPLAYGKDMQEDKEPVFDAAGSIELCIIAMCGMLEGLAVQKDKMLDAAGAGYATATDLADWLVQNLDVPFRQAHRVTGELVKLAERQCSDLEGLSLEDMQSVEPRITSDVYSILSVENSVRSRRSFGGTAPDNVRIAVEDARDRFLRDIGNE